MKRKILLVISALMLISCGQKEQEQAVNQVRPTDVAVTKITLQDITDYYTLPGTVEAWDDITVPSETSGPVTWIGKDEGSFVKQGEAILKINTDNLLANLNSAKVQLKMIKKNISVRKTYMLRKQFHKSSMIQQRKLMI